MKRILFLALKVLWYSAAALAPVSCFEAVKASGGNAPAPETQRAEEAERDAEKAEAEKEAEAAEAALWARALSLARSLDDRQLAAQVLMAGTDGKEKLPPWMREIFSEVPPGALMLFSYNIADSPGAVASFIAEAKEFVAGESLVPFIAVDHEGGAVNRLAGVAGSFPPPLFYGDEALKKGVQAALDEVYGSALSAAAELGGLSITMNLAPVAEVLTGDNSAFLGDRSYGRDASFTGGAASLFVLAMKEKGVASALKHFPGHGATDPHEGRTVLPYAAGELRALVSSFRTVIERAAPAALIVSHAAVPAMDGEPSASLSPAVMRSWIREELGFEGIILTDDFSMKAVRSLFPSTGEASVAALNAGADMVMVWPPDILKTHRAFLAALAEGRLSRERLEEASARIIREKLRYGLLDE
ncbi:MAG: glycoside hydrolase family 3 protein [Spirochaetaceae bacterium]|jgi:beta-N-acetylhexosaminidase|nr:glycoside hydrolase family 3 protein [Spirochaetaceae bacterium]